MFTLAASLLTSTAVRSVGAALLKPVGAVLLVGVILGGTYGYGVHEGREPGKIAAAESAAAAARADADAATHAKADADARASALQTDNATALAKVNEYEARLAAVPACPLSPADAGGLRNIAPDAAEPVAAPATVDHATRRRAKRNPR